ncbi:MAG: hypothetical protein EPN36_13180 [Rhodanobacteraceae bacterium]|nr:MAG: hypothetical protein EPN36_13180 [Rhodanobacteraceae bacterium]
MKNVPPFQVFASIVESRLEILDGELLDALFMIRAHYSLAAIVECCLRLTALRDAFPELAQEPAFSDQTERFEVVRRVGELRGIDPHFVAGSAVRRRGGDGVDVDAEATPLRPYTGESGLCELLLLTPSRHTGQGASPEETERASRHAQDFDRLKAWFAWQTFHHQQRRYARADYERYLKGDGTELLKPGAGSRIYGASLIVRKLGDSRWASEAAWVAGLLYPFTAVRSWDLMGAIDAETRARREHRRVVKTGQWRHAQEHARDTKVVSPVDWASGDDDRASLVRRMDLSSLSRFLRYIWVDRRTRHRHGGTHVGRAHGPGVAREGRLDVRRYGDMLALAYAVDPEDENTGHVVEVHAPPKREERRHDRADVRVPEVVNPNDVLDDPVDEPSVEPVVNLYLGKGDPVAAWFQGKSEAHHIERDNALLLWPKSRLSDVAIRAVTGLVALDPAESMIDWRARLAIGLSLITGRPLDIVAAPIVVSGSAPGRESQLIDDRIAITLGDHILQVPAARPDLKNFEYTNDPLPAYCARWSGTLRLPLPKAWWPLIDASGSGSPRERKRVAKRARALLADLPPNLAITPKGIAGTLRLAVLEAGRGDLALVKALTDADEANLKNLIHYASYDRAEVEALWRRIVSDWVELVESDPETVNPGERVGSPHGIETAKVAAHINDLKQHFKMAVVEKRWRAVYNQLALYLSIWMGLASAGRRVCDPVPGIMTGDGWALIRDKSHADESTDRYVPLSEAVRRQIEVLRALSEMLGLADPAFALPAPGADHLLDLRVFLRANDWQEGGAGGDAAPRRARMKKSSRPFQPKYMDKTTVLRDLPGNWGRKLVRSSSPELAGRFKDAGLGHWVRGRHPWSTTSTFPSAQFKRKWLARQAELERVLGFEVLGVDDLGKCLFGTAIQPLSYLLPARSVARDAATEEAPPMEKGVLPGSEVQTGTELAPDWKGATATDMEHIASERRDSGDVSATGTEVHSASADRAMAETAATSATAIQPIWLRRQVPPESPALPEDEFMGLVRRCEGMDLYRRVFEVRPPDGSAAFELATAMLGCATYRAPEAIRVLAERVCTYIRTRTNIPLFAMRPRARFQRNWLVSKYEFACLAYVEQLILPAIHADLAALPPQDHNVKVGQGKQRIAIGRLIAALALRGGLLNAAHLDAFLYALGEGKPIVAIGDLRLLELSRVRCRRTSQPMRRTMLLEPYLAALVTVERVPLASALAAAALPLPAKRHARWNAALGAYLRSLGVPADITLAAFLAALRQRLMLDASPVITAYASGELLTHDLPVTEFCRLAGFAKPGGTESDTGNDNQVPSDAEQDDPKEQALPADVRDGAHNFARRISGCESESMTTWRDWIQRAREAASTPSQALLCGYASHLVGHYYAGERRHGLGIRQRKKISKYLEIVWNGLVQLEAAGRLGDTLDEEALQALSEVTEGYFHAREHHGAWKDFRQHLADGTVQHSGFTIKGLGSVQPSVVSAKILSRQELDRVEMLLGSVQSGIGTAEYREVATRHFSLTRAIGARRSETEKLRWVDVDGNMLRIRPYPGRSLKTPAAERVVPVGLLNPQTWDTLAKKQQREGGQVIDAIPGRLATGDNFFDAASKVMKTAVGDHDFGPHHLRHTLASAFTLGMLADTVDLTRVERDLPWVKELLPPQEGLDVLLGSEGQCGQGLKAVSAMLGHLHETTTLDHYIHVLCVALHAHQLALPVIPLHVAFEKRIGSRATLHRRAKACRDKGGADADVARALRDELESLAAQEQKKSTEGSGKLPLVVFAAPRVNDVEIVGGSDASRSDVDKLMTRFEAVHRHLAEESGDAPSDLDQMKTALREIAAIPTGKRGSALRRHPMPERGKDGTPLPAMVAAGSADSHAARLIAWLLRLGSEKPDDYRWLLDKWLYTSDAREGSMRLDGDDDVKRVRGFDPGPRVELDVRAVAVSAKRKRKEQKLNYRLRIRFPDLGRAADDSAAMFGQRQAGAVRWAMTWMAARQLAGAQAA